MPFTFSHPALVLPLSKLSPRWFSLTGLIVGSMTPDFEYFFRMRIRSTLSHTLTGLFLFDLPLGILLTFAFHLVIRNRLTDNLPLVLKSRFSQFKNFNWVAYFNGHWLVVFYSVMVGAASHLFWDGFTHTHAYFVSRIPWLDHHVTVFGRPIEVYRIIQHASTLVGAGVIAVFVMGIPRSSDGLGNANPRYWLIFSFISALIVTLRVIIGFDYNPAVQLGIASISAFLIGLFLTPFFVKEISSS